MINNCQSTEIIPGDTGFTVLRFSTGVNDSSDKPVPESVYNQGSIITTNPQKKTQSLNTTNLQFPILNKKYNV